MAPPTVFISDVATVRKSGVNVMFINSNSRIADMQLAQDMFIEPLLGSVLQEAMLDDMNNATGLYDALLLKVQRALAPLAYWLDLPNIQSQITDMGAATFESKNMVAPHRWEFNELRESLALKGCFALEKLIEYLYINKTTLSWTIPDTHKYTFKTGLEFYKYYPLYQPYRTFESLRPLMRQVEDQYIIPTIGEGMFMQLRDAEPVNDEEKIATGYLKSAVANLTLQRACEVLPVRLSDKGFTVYLQSAADDAKPAESNAPSKQMGLLYNTVQRSGETYLMRLSEYLNTKASATLFNIYFTGTYYKAIVAPEDVPDRNEMRSFFSM